MAVEYIDSPNAGFVKLGEKVGLSTITPERKRKVKRSDRSIFPISPTSAESYEDADFRPDSRFSQPASAIPNVFDRFRNIPGGARADAEIPFERVISPININPNQNPNARQEDVDLEEQLRRKSFDFDPVSDYDLSRFDPSSPNYDAQAVADRDAQVALNENFMNLGVGFRDQVKVGIRDLVHRTTGGKAGRSLQDSLLDIELLGGDITKGIEGVTFSSDDNAGLNIDKDGKVTIGINNALSRLGIDATGPTFGGARGSIGGTGFTTNVAKASFDPVEIFDPVGTLGFSPSVSPGVTETQGEDFGAASTPTGAGGAPTVGSVERDFSLSGINIPDAAEIEAQQGFAAAEQAGADSLEDFSGLFNRGGKVQSFMNMKK